MMLTTIRFLAKIMGVAPSTISRALRDDPQIGQAMRQRIQALAQEYHYRPNQLMQSLLTGQSGVIGMVLPRLNFPFCARMLSAVLNSALDAGYRLLIFETHEEINKTFYAIHSLVEQRIDGILIETGHLEPLSRDIIIELRSHNIVPVGIDATISEVAIDNVQTDEMQLAELVVKYLISLGHQTIAYIGPQYHHHQVGRGLAIMRTMQKRLLSTKYFIDVRGITFEQFDPSPVVDTLLAFRPRPTAIIAWEDHLAAKIIGELTRRGITIPGEFSVIGCGNLPVCQFTFPQLTSVEQHPDRIGSKAFEVLLARMQASERCKSPVTLSLPPTLVKRESCARPR